MGQTVTEIWPIFDFFQDGGRLPSWICFTRIWTTHEEYLVVVVTVQNMVGIRAVVSKIYNVNILRVRLENAHSRPKIGVFGAFDLQTGSRATCVFYTKM